MSEKRGRTWAFLQWVESASDGWIQYLEETHIPMVVSPLHDMDVESLEDGTYKKPHYHIVMDFDGKKSYSQILEIVEPLGVKYVEYVNSKSGYLRYLAHLDSPDKAQYDPADMLWLNGMVQDLSRVLTRDERRKILKDITAYVRSERVSEFDFLMGYIDINCLDDWFDVATTSHTVYLTNLIKSIRHGRQTR
jgi:hypothetical protein